MRRKVAAACAVAALVIAVSVAAAPGGQIPDAFDIHATYQNGHIEISFADASGGTTGVTMEILGMAETLRRTYEGHTFKETVPFAGPPRYGWGAHPVILDIQHDTLGDVRIKTEVRNAGEAPAPLLLER